MAEVIFYGDYMTGDILSSLGADRLLSYIDSIVSSAENALPETITIPSSILFSGLTALAFLAIGILFRICFGKKSSFNQAISTSAGILFVYACTIIVYTFNPGDLSQYLSPLPFAFFREDILIILPFWDTDYMLICGQILSLLILCFIVHIMNHILPTGKHLLTWALFRCIAVVLAIFVNLSATWAINTFFPEEFALYAPSILLTVLGAAILIGLFNPLLCIVFSFVNPIFGLLYTFFFSNFIGKQITKAVLSTALICALFLTMEYWGYSVINITDSAILSYLPFGAIALLVWYLFDAKLSNH